MPRETSGAQGAFIRAEDTFCYQWRFLVEAPSRRLHSRIIDRHQEYRPGPRAPSAYTGLPVFISASRPPLLVIGCGSIGERPVRTSLATGRTDVIACDNRPAILAQLSERHWVATTFDWVPVLALRKRRGSGRSLHHPGQRLPRSHRRQTQSALQSWRGDRPINP